MMLQTSSLVKFKPETRLTETSFLKCIVDEFNFELSTLVNGSKYFQKTK